MDFQPDADGIAMAAIQNLYEMVRERDKIIEAHEKRISELEALLTVQNRWMAELVTQLKGTKAGAK